jgi:hypothetical protein
MGRRNYAFLLTFWFVVPCASAQPGGQVTSPGPAPNFPQHAQYNLTGSPTNETDEFDPHSYNFNAVVGGNQLNFNWIFYRVSGDSVQRPFGTYLKSDGFNIVGSSSWPAGGNGNTATYQWTEFGPSGPRFTANYVMTLSNGPATTDAALSQSLKITNPNSAPLTIALFNLVVPFPGASGNNLFAAGGINSITETNGVYNIAVSATTANAFQAATNLSIENLLTGGPAGDLNNSGLPISGFSASPDLISLAYEWSLTIPGNGSDTISDTIAISHAIPEPGTLALAAAAAVVAAGVQLGSCVRRTCDQTESFA